MIPRGSIMKSCTSLSWYSVSWWSTSTSFDRDLLQAMDADWGGSKTSSGSSWARFGVWVSARAKELRTFHEVKWQTWYVRDLTCHYIYIVIRTCFLSANRVSKLSLVLFQSSWYNQSLLRLFWTTCTCTYRILNCILNYHRNVLNRVTNSSRFFLETYNTETLFQIRKLWNKTSISCFRTIQKTNRGIQFIFFSNYKSTSRFSIS